MAESSKTVMNVLSPTAGQLSSKINCSNVRGNETCRNDGKCVCSRCHLVCYCSKECQKSDYHLHKKDCKHMLAEPRWIPNCVREIRFPTWANPLAQPNSLTGGFTRSRWEYFWSNTTAYSVVCSDIKEDKQSVESLAYAFVASGDLSRVLMTIRDLPENIPVEIVINDLNCRVVARNFLLISMLLQHGLEAVDAVIGYWYSFKVTENQRQMAISTIEEIMTAEDTKGVPFKGQHTGCTVKLLGGSVNEVKSVLELIPMAKLANELETVKCTKSRTDILTRAERRDYIERFFAYLQPYHRVAVSRFYEDGLLLPFAADRVPYQCINPLLFHPKFGWLQGDHLNPIESWPVLDVFEIGQTFGVSSNDINGNLFFYLRVLLEKAVARLNEGNVTFLMFAEDAREVGTMLRESGHVFDAIEVSNILDENYVGVKNTLLAMSPILKISPHSRIIGYSMNWIGRNMSLKDSIQQQEVRRKDMYLMKRIKEAELSNPMQANIYSLFFVSVNGQLWQNILPHFASWLTDQLRSVNLKKMGLRYAEPSERTILAPRLGLREGLTNTVSPPLSDKNFELEVYYSEVLASNDWSCTVEFLRTQTHGD